MKTRTKLVALSTAAVLAAGVGTYAYTASAQSGFGPPFMHGMTGGGMGPGMMHGGPGMMGGSHGPFGAAFDPASRLDTLKSELAITAGQEAAWTEYTKTVAETATSMHAAVEGTSGDPQAFFTKMQEQRQKSFDAVKAAADKLLASFDEAQKTKAQEILPGLASAPGMTGGTFGPPWMRHQQGG
jgi:hypothetical protein